MKNKLVKNIVKVLLVFLTAAFLFELQYNFKIGIPQKFSEFVSEKTYPTDVENFLYGHYILDSEEGYSAFMEIMDQTEYRLVPLGFVINLMPKTGSGCFSYKSDSHTEVYIYSDRIQIHKVNSKGKTMFVLDYLPLRKDTAEKIYQDLREQLPLISMKQ